MIELLIYIAGVGWLPWRVRLNSMLLAARLIRGVV